jgi:diaminopimelate epimerase
VGAEVSVETTGGPLSVHLNTGAKLEGPADTVFRGIIEF